MEDYQGAKHRQLTLGCLLLCVVCPPIAVVEDTLGIFLFVLLLTLLGWLLEAF